MTNKKESDEDLLPQYTKIYRWQKDELANPENDDINVSGILRIALTRELKQRKERAS